MSSIVLKVLSRSRGGSILPLRSASTLFKPQYRPIISVLQTPHTRNFTASPALSKKKKGAEPPRTPAKNNNKSSKDAAKNSGKQKGGRDPTADWNDGHKPNADKWCRRMDATTARINAAKDYKQVEKGVMEWTNLLDQGIEAGVTAAHIDATVRRNRQSSASLREWVTDEVDSEMGLWPDEPLFGEVDDETEKRRKEWQESLEEHQEGERYLDDDEEEYIKLSREVLGPKYDTMSEEERETAMVEWEGEELGRETFGPKWDAMSKEEKNKAWEERIIAFEKEILGPKWETMSQEERDKAMTAHIEEQNEKEIEENNLRQMDRNEETDDNMLDDNGEVEEYDPEEEKYDFDEEEYDLKEEEYDLEEEEDIDSQNKRRLEKSQDSRDEDLDAEEFGRRESEEIKKSKREFGFDGPEKKPQEEKP